MSDHFDAEPVLLRRRSQLPAFPTDVLPEPFAGMVRSVAEFTQTDIGMAGTSAVVMLAACAGGRCEIEIRPGWREPLNLFTATAADPGERKSAVLVEMSAPLLDAERQLVDSARSVIVEAEATKDIARKAAERAKVAAGSAEAGDRAQKTADAISAAMRAEAVVVPALPRIVADDVTRRPLGHCWQSSTAAWRSSRPRVESST